MSKPRNAQAIAAWERHGGAHDPGSKKPEVDEHDDIEEQLEEGDTNEPPE